MDFGMFHSETTSLQGYVARVLNGSRTAAFRQSKNRGSLAHALRGNTWIDGFRRNIIVLISVSRLPVMAEVPSTRLYASWFCPYAQRAWMALEEKGAIYEYIEIEPYHRDPSTGRETKNPLSIEEKAARYPEFVAASPRGLVPAIVHGKDKVCDSLVCIEYVDEVLGQESHTLMTNNPGVRAKLRYWMAHANERIIPFYYRQLMVPDKTSQVDAEASMLQGLREYASAMSEDGPFFLGKTFSAADIALAPWFQRMLSVSKAYCGLVIPGTGDFGRLHEWFNAVQQRDCYTATRTDEGRLILNYAGYANNSATSDAAQRFRKKAKL